MLFHQSIKKRENRGPEVSTKIESEFLSFAQFHIVDITSKLYRENIYYSNDTLVMKIKIKEAKSRNKDR